MKETIKSYLKWSNQLEMIYLSDKNQITKRVVTVKRLTGDYIIGFCHSKREWRKFKMDNILSAVPVKNQHAS